MNWLPDMDLNHDKQIQSLLCYRYTIGQAGASGKLEGLTAQSSRQTIIPNGRALFHVRAVFSRIRVKQRRAPAQRLRLFNQAERVLGAPRARMSSYVDSFCHPHGTCIVSNFYPLLKPWASFNCPSGAVH
jgi:hypothetical protein